MNAPLSSVLLAVSDHRVGNQVALVLAAVGVPIILFLLEKRRKRQMTTARLEIPVGLEPEPSPSGQTAPTITIHPRIVAIITAAVHEAICGDAKILKILATGEGDSVAPLQQWSIEGRRQIYSSHQLR